MELVLIALVILLDVRTERVSAHILIEEEPCRNVVGQLECLLQIATLHLYYRLIHPFLSPEYPSREHLLGCQSFVGSCSVEFLGEIDGEGLHGADAVVVEDEQLAELLCCLFGQGVGRMVCSRGGATEERSYSHDCEERSLAEMLASEQGAVSSARIEEHEDEGKEK